MVSQDCPNELIEDGGHQQGHDEEDSKVQQVDGHVEAAGHLIATFQALGLTDSEIHEEETKQAVDGPAHLTEAHSGLLGSGHGAHGLYLLQVADGNVPAATGCPVAPEAAGSHDPPTSV